MDFLDMIFNLIMSYLGMIADYQALFFSVLFAVCIQVVVIFLKILKGRW